MNFQNSFREFSVKFDTFLKFCCEIMHFFPWIRFVPNNVLYFGDHIDVTDIDC